MNRGDGKDDRFDPGRFRPVALFRERVHAYWKFVWKCWKTAFDWTVLLYIVVPALWIGGGTYLDWLRHPPTWMTDIPPAILFSLVGLLFSGSRLRTFAESGDGLFLNRNRQWRKRFARLGILYAAIVLTALSGIVILVLLPLWKNGTGFSHSTGYWLLFGWFASSWGVGWTLVKDRISQKGTGWWKTVLMLGVRSAATALFAGAALWATNSGTLVWGALAGLVTLGAMAMGFLRVRASGTFMHELSVERDAFVSAVGWMLKDTMEKKQLPKSGRPIFLSGSVTLFKRRGAVERLAESWIKSIMCGCCLRLPFSDASRSDSFHCRYRLPYGSSCRFCCSAGCKGNGAIG